MNWIKWLSTASQPFLMLHLFNVTVTPSLEVTLLLLHNCNFSTVMNHNLNISYAGCVICDPCGVATHMLWTADLARFYEGKHLSLRSISDLTFQIMSQVSYLGDVCQVKWLWQMLPYLKEKLTVYLTKTFLVPTSQHIRVSTKSKCLFEHRLPRQLLFI